MARLKAGLQFARKRLTNIAFHKPLVSLISPNGIIGAMRFRLAFLLLVFLCSACTPAVEPRLPTSTVVPPTATFTLVPVSKTPTPTQTVIPSFTATKRTPNDTLTPEPVLQICSPLAGETLDELFEIVTDPYNPPRPGKDDRHHGTDFSYYRRKDRTTIAGEVIQAIFSGKVVAVVSNRLPYGNMVIVETVGAELPAELADVLGVASDESLYHLYAHFEQNPQVTLGQWIDCGQPLGQVGATGYNIVNPHLHLETRLGPSGADFSVGMAYYSTAASEQERSNYELWRTSGAYRHFDPMILMDWYLQNQVGD
jgi:murein DD-endopeptidase MepM/ murein hydrolase activator NlpD